MTIAVVGGAGYIGSHIVRLLHSNGQPLVVVDDFSAGHRWAVPPGVAREEISIHQTGAVAQALLAHGVDAVIHLAARIEVGESVRDPLRTYHDNVAGSLSLLRACLSAGVSRFVLSSTAAVYASSDQPLTEGSPLIPANPYGASKLMVERALEDCAAAYGLKAVALRYFNAAGADPSGTIGEAHAPETHLVPLVIQAALGRRADIKIFGIDYPTPDGTAIRDYIHVCDLAEAHLLAVDWLRGQSGSAGLKTALNLGTGTGASVREVIDAVAAAAEVSFPVVEADRRAGDPPRLVADPTRAQQLLGWTATRSSLPRIIGDALRWHRSASAIDP